MKKILLYLFLLVVCELQAQEKINSFIVKVADNSSSNFFFTDLDYGSDKTISVYGKSWRMGTLTVTKDGKKTDFGSGNRMLPSALSIAISNDGKQTLSQSFINLQSIDWMDMKGYEYKAVDPTTSREFASSNDKSFEEIKMGYPKAFGVARGETASFYNYNLEITTFKTNLIETVTQYTFDRVRNKLVAQTPERSIITPKMPAIDGKYLYEAQFFKDNKRKMLACVAGIAKKGEGRFYGMQHRKVVTLGSTGDLINSFDVTFTYPRSVVFASAFGVSVTDTLATFEDGGIFIFGKTPGAGKNNDPDQTNYDFVTIDGQGEQTSKGSFKFGTEKRGLYPVYAYKKDNTIFIVAKGVGKDQPSYAILALDNSGLIATKEYTYDQLKLKTFGPYDKGLTTNYGRNFKVTNHLNLSSGGVLLCGEAYEEVTPMGASFTDPKVIDYSSQVFLHIDAEGNLVKNFVVEKLEQDSKKIYTRQNFIQGKNNKYYFVSEERIGNNNFPILTAVDLAAGTAKKLPLKLDNIYNIDGDIIYRYFPERDELMFLGRTPDKDSYTLSCSVYKLN